jgi:UTP--glucose-1-phosphate uridylyltransferase
MKKIKKAIVAVAGSGTRLLPVTKSMPKEMLPIVDKPIIQLVVEELVEAGIEDIIMVTKWDKKPLEDHFDHSWGLENDLEKNGKDELLKEIKEIPKLANFIYVRQKPQYGNGVPILSAKSLVKDEPFVFCYGDDIVKSKTSFSKQMVEEYEEEGHLMMGVQEVSRDLVKKYGIVKLKKDSMKIEGMVEKPSIEEAPSNFAAFGRFILNQEIINYLEKTPLGKGGELWLTDAISEYVKSGGEFYAKKVEDGEWMTTGDPLNYLKANLAYALERDDIGDDLKNYIKKELIR